MMTTVDMLLIEIIHTLFLEIHYHFVEVPIGVAPIEERDL